MVTVKVPDEKPGIADRQECENCSVWKTALSTIGGFNPGQGEQGRE